MFYTKYRPQKFSELSKPNEVADSLATQVSSSKYSHAYLFIGPRGTGKTSLARILAKAINCEHLEKDGNPCDECPNCINIKNGTFLDLIEIDAASNRGIDDIRELKDKIKLAPSVGKNKIYIIDEVHMLTTEAFNALLKTLEEPPRNTVFILCTTEAHKVPETIKSRCQVFKFKRASLAQLVAKLKGIAKSEKFKITDQDLEKIARASLGGFRDAETYLQQIIEGDVRIESLLGLTALDTYEDFILFIIKKDLASVLKLINKIYDDGIDLYVWCGEVIKLSRDLLLLNSGVPSNDIDIDLKYIEGLSIEIKNSGPLFFVHFIDVLSKAHVQIKSSFIPQLPLELAVVELCTLENNVAGIDNEKVSPKAPTDKKNETPIVKKQTKSVASEKDTPVETPSIQETKEAKKIIVEDIEEMKSKSEEPLGENILNAIQERWEDLLNVAKNVNGSIFGLLKASNPVKMEGKNLILEVFYTFHKDRLESPRNRAIVEGFIKDLHAMEVGIKCFVNGEKPERYKSNEVGILTDKNVVPAKVSVPFDRGSILEMLDGGLPIV